ncbi:MAG: DNA polymerase III subunit delta' [Chromatiaceae bacterium]|nr:DNA polymerase III subunit delta' [Chromatiaceae bacterium]
MTTPAPLEASPPWLKEPWAALQGARQADRFPHALLLTGPAGVGKRRLLEALAHSLLCHGTLAGGWACGQCPDCRLLAAGTHPDLARVGPDEEGKSGEIKVDAIRALAGAEGLTAHRGGWKLILIDPAHRLNTSAANALLKTLEEPAPSTLLCLVSEQPSRLPATIRSRCQVLRLAVPPEAEALAWLAPRTAGFDAATLLHLAHGAPLRALELANPEHLALRDRLIRGFVEVAQGKRDPLAEAATWNQAEPALLLEWLGGWVSDLLRLIPELIGSRPRLINADWAGDFRTLADQVDPAAGHRFLRQVWRVGASDTTNLNRLLLFETWLLEWARLYSPAAGHHSR